MEGASRKQKKQIKKAYAQYAEREKKAMTQRKFMFVQPPENWPRPPGKFLSMEVVETRTNGTKLFTFKKSLEY